MAHRLVPSFLSQRSEDPFNSTSHPQHHGPKYIGVEGGLGASLMAHTNYRPRTITSCAEIEWLKLGAEIDLAVIIRGMFVDLKTR